MAYYSVPLGPKSVGDQSVAVLYQVKKHERESNEWAIVQVVAAREQFEARNEGIPVAGLVAVTTANHFTEAAQKQALENGVTLIDGDDLRRWILRTGLTPLANLGKSQSAPYEAVRV